MKAFVSFILLLILFSFSYVAMVTHAHEDSVYIKFLKKAGAEEILLSWVAENFPQGEVDQSLLSRLHYSISPGVFELEKGAELDSMPMHEKGMRVELVISDMNLIDAVLIDRSARAGIIILVNGNFETLPIEQSWIKPKTDKIAVYSDREYRK